MKLDDFSCRHLLAWCKSEFFYDEVETNYQHLKDFMKTLDAEEFAYCLDKGWRYTYARYIEAIA